MNLFFLNKIAGAALLTLLALIGLNTIADMLYQTHKPEKPGFPVQTAAKEPSQETKKTEAPAKPAEKISPAALLAKASAERGQKGAKKCSICHSFKQGGNNGIGPNLYGIVGKKMAAVTGYSYSDAMKAKAAAGGLWGYDELFGFLAKPRKYLPGTKMGFPGVKKPSQLADLIAYLRTLSANPVPLPKP